VSGALVVAALAAAATAAQAAELVVAVMPFGDRQIEARAARFFVVLALAERGDFVRARPLADSLLADSDAWDEELRKLMATWPTDRPTSSWGRDRR